MGSAALTRAGRPRQQPSITKLEIVSGCKLSGRGAGRPLILTTPAAFRVSVALSRALRYLGYLVFQGL